MTLRSTSEMLVELDFFNSSLVMAWTGLGVSVSVWRILKPVTASS